MKVQIALLIISCYLYTVAPDYMDSIYMSGIVLVSIIATSLNFNNENNNNIKKQYLRHSLIFVIVYFVVFFQYDIDYVLGLVDVNESTSLIWYDTKVVCKSMAIANIGLISFYIGYQLIKISKTKRARDSIYEFRKTPLLIVMLWALQLLYLVFVNKNYLINGYTNKIEQGAIAFHINIYIQGLLFAGYTIKSYIIKKTFTNPSFELFFKKFFSLLVFSIVWIFLILLSGRRTEALKDLLLILISFLYVSQHKFKFVQIAVPLFVLSLLMGIIAVIRMADANSYVDAVNVLQEKATISPLTQELAFNSSSLHIATSNIPDVIGYNYGITFIIGMLVLVPGLQPFVLNAFGTPETLKGSAWLLTDITGKDFGLGTSVIADIYISFGVWGILPLMLIWGMLLRYLENKTFSSSQINPYLLAFSFCVFTSLIYVVRSSLTSVFESLSYVLIIIYLFSKRKKTVIK